MNNYSVTIKNGKPGEDLNCVRDRLAKYFPSSIYRMTDSLKASPNSFCHEPREIYKDVSAYLGPDEKCIEKWKKSDRIDLMNDAQNETEEWILSSHLERAAQFLLAEGESSQQRIDAYFSLVKHYALLMYRSMKSFISFQPTSLPACLVFFKGEDRFEVHSKVLQTRKTPFIFTLQEDAFELASKLVNETQEFLIESIYRNCNFHLTIKNLDAIEIDNFNVLIASSDSISQLKTRENFKECSSERNDLAFKLVGTIGEVEIFEHPSPFLRNAVFLLQSDREDFFGKALSYSHYILGYNSGILKPELPRFTQRDAWHIRPEKIRVVKFGENE